MPFLPCSGGEHGQNPGLFDVMAFHIGRAPRDEPGDPAPADQACRADRGWLEKGRRYYVDVPVNPVYHALGTAVEWCQRRVRRDLRKVG